MSTIGKAGRLLDLFSAATPEWGVSEAAASLGIPRSTAHFLLTGLTEAGLLQMRRRGRYELGWRIFELGEVQRSSSSLAPMARPVMETFVRRFGETVCLGVFLRDSVLYIDKVVGDVPLSVMGPRIGARYDAHGHASGRALLAALPPQTVEEQLRGRELRVPSSNSPVDPDDLLRELETIRRTGVAFDYGEAVQDVGCVAVGIRGPQGDVVASLSLSAPLRRFSSREREFVAAARGAAAQISERLCSPDGSDW
ncbi:IclR family transcriptional regulator [Streptomyces sp. NPDC059582]|uniref:IclR family transcriptional regulator n=1 Tax=Streptomyces sp. NPDC059582 TaxID=3346875 RepID=UPI0036B976BB